MNRQYCVKLLEFVVRLYLECLIIEGLHEVVGLTAQNRLVEVELVWPADDFAVRECLRVVEPGSGVSLAGQ